jgi:spermidine synthase
MTTSRAAPLSLPLRPLFITTVLAGSFLLFLVQPLFGRVVLPVLGGSPSVWNVAMLFYQAVLLLGYLYANQLQRLPVARQLAVHLGLFTVAALTLPIGMAGWYPAAGSGNPTLWLLGLLAVSIGPVFFVASAQAPLMQAWFARSGDPDAANPYFLYAASNLGSFGALIAYPLLVEPFAGLWPQRIGWSAGFVGLALLVALCGLAARSSGAVVAAPAAPADISGRQRLRWVALSAVASGLLLSTTTHLTTDLMAMPLLWVVPLAIYLLSFVIAFSQAGPAATRQAVGLAPLLLLVLAAPVFQAGNGPVVGVVLAIAGLLLLLVLTVALHGTLALERPPASGLTSFYVWMSVGGALGGLFCALVAPLLFSWPWEHPLLLLAAALLLKGEPRSALPERRVVAILMLGAMALLALAVGSRFFTAPLTPKLLPGPATAGALAAMLLLAWLTIGRRWLFTAMLALGMFALGGGAQLAKVLAGLHQRSFFGVYTVEDRKADGMRWLMHGTTLHGAQSLDPARARRMMTYYVPESGIGRAMTAAPALFGRQARIGVVGLGAGTLACYARPGQHWTFFEIDPVVVEIARQDFTYLAACAPDAAMITGDARLTLQAEAAARFDLLAVDAFSSDSIPLHLMTLEALGIYGRALAPDGLLLIHISNRFLDLEPVLARMAQAGGWQSARLTYVPTGPVAGTLQARSIWIALSRRPERLAQLRAAGGDWQNLRREPGTPLWRDDFASVLPALKL